MSAGGGILKDYLKAVYALQLELGYATSQKLSGLLGRSEVWCSRVLSRLEAMGLVRRLNQQRGGYVLTSEGRRMLTVVLTGGVFDIIHVGHLATLREAKKLGNTLVVVVARDETVRRLKGRSPINREENRLEIVRSLKPVDIALLGDEEDPYETVRKVRPDIIALGYDQQHNEDEIRDKLAEMGLHARVVRLGVAVPNAKTSLIISKIQGS